MMASSACVPFIRNVLPISFEAELLKMCHMEVWASHQQV